MGLWHKFPPVSQGCKAYRLDRCRPNAFTQRSQKGIWHRPKLTLRPPGNLDVADFQTNSLYDVSVPAMIDCSGTIANYHRLCVAYG